MARLQSDNEKLLREVHEERDRIIHEARDAFNKLINQAQLEAKKLADRCRPLLWMAKTLVLRFIAVEMHAEAQDVAGHKGGDVRTDPKVLRRVSQILHKEGLHFANLFYIFE